LIYLVVLGGGTEISLRISARLFLQVESKDIMRVSVSKNIFASVGGGPDKGLQIGAFGIDGGRRLESGNLIRKQCRLRKGAYFARLAIALALLRMLVACASASAFV